MTSGTAGRWCALRFFSHAAGTLALFLTQRCCAPRPQLSTREGLAEAQQSEYWKQACSYERGVAHHRPITSAGGQQYSPAVESSFEEQRWQDYSQAGLQHASAGVMPPGWYNVPMTRPDGVTALALTYVPFHFAAPA